MFQHEYVCSLQLQYKPILPLVMPVKKTANTDSDNKTLALITETFV